LRDYGIEPLIWDGDPECDHTFDSDNAYHDNLRYRVGHNTIVGNFKNPEIYTIRTPRPNGSGGKTDFIKNTHAKKDKDNISEYVDYNDRATYSQICHKCNAWRGSLGLEPAMDMYINHLCSIFDEAKRVLRDDGTLWVNLGDTYASGNRDNGNGYDDTRWELSKEGKNCKGWHIQPNRKLENYPSKSLCMIPFRFAIEMVNRGWILRNDIIWHKPNCMPSSAKDRFTVDFEHVFFFTKSKRYYFEQQFEKLKETTIKDKRMITGYTNIRGRSWDKDVNSLHGNMGSMKVNAQGRNKRAVWSITTKGFSGAHFATFPETLVEPMIKAGCPEGGVVYDPFMGAGTVAVVAKRLNRHYIGSELKQEYIDMANRRIAKEITQTEFAFAGG
jgi:site-specific DNA-methyltransferase (cytosine-N4-specific)